MFTVKGKTKQYILQFVPSYTTEKKRGAIKMEERAYWGTLNAIFLDIPNARKMVADLLTAISTTERNERDEQTRLARIETDRIAAREALNAANSPAIQNRKAIIAFRVANGLCENILCKTCKMRPKTTKSEERWTRNGMVTVETKLDGSDW